MATPQGQLESLFDSPPPVLTNVEARPQRTRRGAAQAPSPAPEDAQPRAPSNPYGAFDAQTKGGWSIQHADSLKGWFRQTYGRELPVTAAGQSGTHTRMGLDHSDSLDVGINPASEEGKALRDYLRANRVPFLAYDRAVPGAATNAHIHIGFPSHRGAAGEAARLGSLEDFFDASGAQSLDAVSSLFDGEEVGDVVTVNASGASPAAPLPPLRARAAYDPATFEGRRSRDERAQLERTSGAFLEVTAPLPSEDKLSDVAAGGEMVRAAYVRALVSRGVPEAEASKLVGSDYSLKNKKGEAVAPADVFSDDNLDTTARTMRVKIDAAHLSKLADSYRASRGALARASDWATDDERGAGEKLLDVAGAVAAPVAKGAGYVARPFQAASAGVWAATRGHNPVHEAYDTLTTGETSPTGSNPVGNYLRDSAVLNRINPRLGRLLGFGADMIVDPANLIGLGFVGKGAKAIAGAGRVARAAEEVRAVGRALSLLERGIVEARPLGLVDEAVALRAAIEASSAGRVAALEGRLSRVTEVTRKLRAGETLSADEAALYAEVRAARTPGVEQHFDTELVTDDGRRLVSSSETGEVHDLATGEPVTLDAEPSAAVRAEQARYAREREAAARTAGDASLAEEFGGEATGAEGKGFPVERVAEQRGDLRRLAAYHVNNGARDFADFTALMVDDLGEGIRPHLREIYDDVRPVTGQQAEGAGSVDHLFDAPEPAAVQRTAAAVAEDIRVTHARERGEFYSREAAGAKDPVHRAEAERLAREYEDEAADLAVERRLDDIAGRVREGGPAAPDELADLERAVLAEDGALTYAEVAVSPVSSKGARAPKASAAPAVKSPMRRAWDKGLDLFDASKSLFASLDASAAGRQAFVPLLFDTRDTLRALREGLPSALGRNHEAFARWLDAQPDASMWREMGLDLDTLTGARNEFFPSSLAEKIPGYGRAVIKPSDRVMTAQLDAVRLYNARSWDESLRAMGATPETHPEDYKAVANLINVASGRGELGKVGQALYPVTRRVIFSPKLLKSRFTILNPLTYSKLPPAARRVAARKLGKAAAKFAGIVGLAYLTADEVGLNPLRGNFLHARYGNTTYDLSGGLANKLRFVFQLVQSVGSTAGAVGRGDAVKYEETPLGVAGRFLRSQLAPSASLVPDAVTGETYDGKPFTWAEGVARRITPGFAQDVYDGFAEGSGAGDVAKTLPAFIGISTRTRDREAMRREWDRARAASRTAEARERTAAVMKDAPAAVRDELVRRGVSLDEADAALAGQIAEAVQRARSGDGWAGLSERQRKTFLENVIAGVRKEAGAPSAKREQSAARAKDDERVGLTGRAAEEVERLGVVVDPVFNGHKVGVFTGESVGFKGEHLGQTPEQLQEYRRQLVEETQREVERVTAFAGFDSKPDAMKRRALQTAVDRVKRRVRGAFHFGTRRRDYGEHERLEEYQRRLEGRSRQPAPGERVNL